MAGAAGAAMLATAGAREVGPFRLPPPGRRTGTTRIRGRTIAWRVEAGETAMPPVSARPEATMFSVAYLASGPPARPVTFVWNGGPGSATWHLREDLSPRITAPSPERPHYRFADNVHSIVDATDLVFVDAPGIGYSRMLVPAAKRRYHGIEEDGRAFTLFIADWLRSHGRSDAPVYLMGESYGGTRVGQVARGLHEHGLAIRGTVLISPTTSATDRAQPVHDLPPQACIAHYHGRGDHRTATIEGLLRDVQAFATGPYASAVARGKRLAGDERQAIAAIVAGYTGIAQDVVVQNGLTVPTDAFADLLLADRRLRVSTYDGRQTSARPMPGAPGSVVDRDEGFDRTESIEALIRRDLGYAAVGGYVRDPSVTDPWNRKVGRPADLPGILASLMRTNARMRVLLVGGLYDLVVPYPGPADELAAALPADRFMLRIYPCGHAVYGDAELRPRTTDELAQWYADA